jgi:hypothetical protein
MWLELVLHGVRSWQQFMTRECPASRECGIRRLYQFGGKTSAPCLASNRARENR